jgi:hypothetical protein
VAAPSLRWRLSALVGAGVILAGGALAVATAAADDPPAEPRLDVLDRTVDGISYRCLSDGAGGLWCERLWNEAEPSADCGPFGDQPCGAQSTEPEEQP